MTSTTFFSFIPLSPSSTRSFFVLCQYAPAVSALLQTRKSYKQYIYSSLDYLTSLFQLRPLCLYMGFLQCYVCTLLRSLFFRYKHCWVRYRTCFVKVSFEKIQIQGPGNNSNDIDSRDFVCEQINRLVSNICQCSIGFSIMSLNHHQLQVRFCTKNLQSVDVQLCTSYIMLSLAPVQTFTHQEDTTWISWQDE